MLPESNQGMVINVGFKLGIILWQDQHMGCVDANLPAGYSDSGKDAGRLAAAWALFEAQEKIVSAVSPRALSRHLICVHIF
jgi:hypothetical protein